MTMPELKPLDNSIKKENLVEVGVICKRDNSGKFYDPEPIFQEIAKEKQSNFEKAIVNEFANLMLDFINKNQLING